MEEYGIEPTHNGTEMKATKIFAKKFTTNTEEIFRYKLLQTLKEIKENTKNLLK